MEKYLYTTDKQLTDYNVWMAFPGITSFSLSSLGYLWMFKNIDMLKDVFIERVCTDTEKTQIMPSDVHLMGFSFSFDLDFLNIFKMMEKYKIPLKSSERDEDHSLIFGGGPVLTANPAPYQDFFDFIIVGDGEDVNTQAVELARLNRDKSKDEILKILSEIEGIYVPKFPKQVKKVTNPVSKCIYTPILSENSFFKDTFIIEIARGCANRCGFCLASYLNLPARFVDYDDIIATIDMGLEHTNKIALLGALISAHPRFEDICRYIDSKDGVEMSVSSLRADAISPDIVKTLVKAGQKNTTIAIEAGNDRLRKVINKNLDEKQIIETVRIARENGLKGLKIYAMIGLPTECQADLDEMLALAKKLKLANKGFDLSFAFSSFVPKPHTPFQWCKREETKSLEDKQNYLKKEFHKLGQKARFSSAKWDYYQTVLSRGDKSMGDYVIEVYKQGGNIGAFKSAARDVFDTDAYVTREYGLDEELPWDFIEVSPGKDFLKREYNRLLQL